MRDRLRDRARLAAIVAAACATIGTAPALAQGGVEPELSEATFQAIVRCLSVGKEIVMAPALACVERGTGGADAKKAKMPLDGDWNEVCRNPQDPRRLPADIIKRIVAQKDTAIAPSGIRIVGAVLCARASDGIGLDLAGLDLPYSLVIDRSVVNGHLEARNLRIKGDFSFDHVVVLRTLRLNRARVEGSVYGEGSFVDTLQVWDTHVSGAWRHSDAVVFSDALFHRASISGDLSMKGSAFTRFWLQSSPIGGTLELSNTEARCAYQINASTVGYLSANRAGFGRIKAAGTDMAVDHPWWNRALSSEARQVFESATFKNHVDAEKKRIENRVTRDNKPAGPRVLPGCQDTSRSEYMEFYILDSTVQAAACLASFAWLAPKGPLPETGHPVSILAMNGTRINGNLIVDLWHDPASEPGTTQAKRPDYAELQPGQAAYDRVSEKHKFEAISLSAGALIYDFSDNTRPYFTYLDGLKFDRVHKAKPACTSDSGAKLAEAVTLPSVDDVLQWLDKNAAPSSQPFVAFATAFEQAGESATPLRIRRKTVDLCEKTTPWIPSTLGLRSFLERQCPGRRFNGAEAEGTPTPAAKAETAPAAKVDPAPAAKAEHAPAAKGELGIVAAVNRFFGASADFVMLMWQWTLFVLADHGLRPGKVVWSVAITLAVFFLWFWFVLGVVGFEPKGKEAARAAGSPPIVWPIGFLFLFDRLIPAYKIRDEHYAIARVYRRASAKTASDPSPEEGPPHRMHYLGGTFLVSPAGDAKLRKLDKWLGVLRIIGVLFTVFLLAAINTLVAR